MTAFGADKVEAVFVGEFRMALGARGQSAHGGRWGPYRLKGVDVSLPSWTQVLWAAAAQSKVSKSRKIHDSW
ncbi:hypothetical protein D9M72_657740 [compost metagenome]